MVREYREDRRKGSLIEIENKSFDCIYFFNKLVMNKYFSNLKYGFCNWKDDLLLDREIYLVMGSSI